MGVSKKIICMNTLQLLLMINIKFTLFLILGFDILILLPCLMTNSMTLEPELIILLFLKAPADILFLQAVIVCRQVFSDLNRFLNNPWEQVHHVCSKELAENSND